MSGDASKRSEERLADALAAYDDALAVGRETPAEALEEAVDPTLRSEWNRLAAFLTLVERAWPRNGAATDHSTESIPSGIAPRTDPNWSEAGDRFGRFRILRVLGQGGFGVVFLAWDPSLRRQVALKVPQPEAMIAPEARKRFFREARAAAGLDHPGIVPIYEADSVGTISYIASAYIPGPTLAEWLSRQPAPVPPRDAAALVAALARAVQHAHDRGVLHRDLKPSNILLQPPADDDPACDFGVHLGEFQPRITDFSLAWQADGDGPKTLSGVPLGTPPYMAPEQAAGRLRAIGPPTDVYGLGSILYELLVGHPAFEADSQVETLRMVIQDEPTPPRRMRRDLPVALDAIALKCLAKDSARRYPTACELAEDLERFLRGEPARARPPSWREQVARRARRHPAALSVLAIAALCTGTLVIGWRWYAQQLEASRQTAHQRDADARRSEDARRRTRYVADLRQAAEHLRSDQTTLAHNLLARYRSRPGEDDLREFSWYHLWRRCHLERRTLPGPRDVVYAVEFSPDGELLAGACRDGSVLIWETVGWKVVRTIAASPKEVNFATFSPDGKAIATVDDEGKLKLWEMVSGRLLREIPAHQGDAVIARFTHDGKTIITGGRDDRLIKLWDRASGHEQTAFRVGDGKLESAALSPGGSVLACVGARAISLHRAIDGKRFGSIPAEDEVQCVVFSHDGKSLATAHESDRIVRLWDVSTRRLIREFAGHNGGVYSVVFSADDRTIVSGSRDYTLRRWDVATGAQLGVLSGHTERVWAVAIAPDGRTVVSAGADGTVRLWDLEPAAARVRLPVGETSAIAFSADGRVLKTFELGPRRAVTSWDVRSGRVLDRVPVVLPKNVRMSAFSNDCRLLAVMDHESDLTVHDLATGRNQRFHDPAPRLCFDLEFSPDNRFLMVSRGRRIWDLSNQCLVRLPWAEGCEKCFSPSGEIVTLVTDQAAHLWNPDTGQERVLRIKTSGPSVVRFSPDGRLVVITSTSQHIVICTVAPLQPRTTVPEQAHDPRTLAFSPDGKTLAFGLDVPSARFCDTATGEVLLTVDGLSDVPHMLRFSPDGRAVALLTCESPGRLSEVTLLRATQDDRDSAVPDPNWHDPPHP